MAPFGTLPAHALAWPRPTRAALEARAAAVAHEVVGDVFDLAQLDGGSAPWPDATFDTITTVAELCRFADLSVVAGEIRDHLRDGGKLVVVEPAARAGMVATAGQPGHVAARAADPAPRPRRALGAAPLRLALLSRRARHHPGRAVEPALHRGRRLRPDRPAGAGPGRRRPPTRHS
ncbi:MAG: methyltransferase domain-containing protein [Acidimicrobiales bacterium]